MSYFYVLCTILLTVYGQLIIKWQVFQAGTFPEGASEKIRFLLQLLLNPWVISAFLAALLASLSWMAAITKLQLSHAYPFMSLAFILVMLFSGWLFNEPITTPKVIGVALVILGLAIGSQG
jgi:multidrug transporter EmrE-like cation transporter